MKRKVTTPNATSSPTKAAGGPPAVVARPSKSKVGNADAPPAKGKAVASEASSPSAMELLRIAQWFGLIAPKQMLCSSVPDDAESIVGSVPRGSDGVFRSSLEDAAHLFLLADSVAKRCRDGDPFLLRKLHDEEQERARQLERIWACAKSGELLSTEQAHKRFGFKTYAPFSKSLREFGYWHREGDDISADVVRVLGILRKQKATDEKKRYRAALKAGAGTGGSVNSTMPARS
ncbi:MAG: hypothetical protein ACOYM3_31840, partial [Terrimicrobiaceae bacterium]